MSKYYSFKLYTYLIKNELIDYSSNQLEQTIYKFNQLL